MKKIKISALVLCASMLVGITGCQATDKPNEASFSQAEVEAETSAEDTTAVAEETEPVVTDSGVDFLEGYEKFELTSTDLVNGVWADIISNARGNNSSPELSYPNSFSISFFVIWSCGRSWS